MKPYQFEPERGSSSEIKKKKKGKDEESEIREDKRRKNRLTNDSLDVKVSGILRHELQSEL